MLKRRSTTFTAQDLINNSFQYVFANPSCIAPQKDPNDFFELLNAVLESESSLNGGSLSLALSAANCTTDQQENLPVIKLDDVDGYHGSCLDPLSLSGVSSGQAIPVELVPLGDLLHMANDRISSLATFPSIASYVNSEDAIYLYPMFSSDLTLRYKPFIQVEELTNTFPSWVTGDFLYFMEMRLAKEISLTYNVDSWDSSKEEEMKERVHKCDIRNTSARNFSRKNLKPFYFNFNSSRTVAGRLRDAP